MKSILLVISVLLSMQVNAQKEIAVESSAKDYPLNIVQPDGSIKVVQVAQMQGKAIILQWWADQCEGSENNLILFNDIAKKFKDEALFYAVTYDKLQNIHAFQQKNKFNFSFVRDKIQWANAYFPTGPASHLVIIDSLGTCIYRGNPYILSESVLEALLKTNNLPVKIKSEAELAKTAQIIHNRFKIAPQTAGFKTSAYDSNLPIDGSSRYSEGLYYYVYNASIYRIYKDGLFLSDYQIKMPDTLRNRLSLKETSKLFSVGFQLKERDPKLGTYLKSFNDSLNMAFNLKSKFVLKDDSVVIIKNIKQGPVLSKSLIYNSNSTKAEGNTLVLKGVNARDLCSAFNRYMNMIFLSDIASNVTYDARITLDLKSIDRRLIQEQLQKQGIESEIKVIKYYFLEFL